MKIDQSFVQSLDTDKDDARIVAAVVDLAANLGLRSIAEGVETKMQLDRLRDLGCGQAQGYFSPGRFHRLAFRRPPGSPPGSRYP